MWILVVIFIGFGGSSMSTIPNYNSKVECERAAIEFINKVNELSQRGAAISFCISGSDR